MLKRKKNDMKMTDSFIPLIELQLENVSYAPISVASQKGIKTIGSTKNKLKNSNSDKITSSQQPQRINVLNNIYTTISPFKLTAWMGPSGSGKTSLISVAANLIRSNDDLLPDSLITVNGEEGKLPKRFVGVVWQDDLLLSNLTVQENLYFAARLKTPQSITDDEVMQMVVETMKELGLLHIRHSLVGNAVGLIRGISGGERKRVAVGIEMVVKPSLLLLDEPTSGLDATTAQSLIQTLQHLARKKGHSIVVVIHQPRTTIYNMFDHLLLLSKGYMIYDGHPRKARSFLESCPNTPKLPPETGIADWIMDIVTVDENTCTVDNSKKQCERALVQGWMKQQSNQKNWTIPNEDNEDSSSITNSVSSNSKPKEKINVPTTVDEDVNERSSSQYQKQQEQHRPKFERRLSSLRELYAAPKFHISFWKQLQLLTKRTLKQQRGERLTITALSLQLTYLFFTALFWWQLPDTTQHIFEHYSLLFFILIAQSNGIVVNAVTVFQHERTLLKRERAKKMYRVSSYFIAKTISDMSNNVLLPVLYASLSYWTAGFRPTAIAFLKYTFSLYWSFSTAQSMGLFISVLIPNATLALVLAPPITLFFMILGGFYIPFRNMHAGIRWASYLSFARYSYSSLIVNEYGGRDVPCSVDDYDGGSANTGLVVAECPLPGDDVIASLGIEGITEDYWFNVGMIILLQIVFRISAYGILRKSD